LTPNLKVQIDFFFFFLKFDFGIKETKYLPNCM
jgi:hypothetical protein